jgi:hypothetical protein
MEVIMKTWKEVFAYDEKTKEFIGIVLAYASPAELELGELNYLMPANSTEKAPPSCGIHQKQVFDEWHGEWTIESDFRGQEFWDQKTKERRIYRLGEKPDMSKVTDKEPLGLVEYDGQKWVPKPMDDDLLRAYEWNKKKKKWEKRKVNLQGSEIALEIKRLIFNENVLNLNISEKLSASTFCTKYLDVLISTGEINKSDYNLLMSKLIAELKKAFKANLSIFEDALEMSLSGKDFSS